METIRCCCCKVHINCCVCVFGCDITYQKSLENIPKFTALTLADWISSGVKETDGKSWNFFKEKYVHGESVAQVPRPDGTGTDYVLQARCHRSQKKRLSPHYLNVYYINKDGRAEVREAHCSCTAGSGGLCNHILAVIYQFLDYSSCKLTEIPSDVSCTSRSQEWNVPRQDPILPLPVMGTHYAKAETDRSGKRKRPPVFCKLYDPRRKFFKEAFENVGVIPAVVGLSKNWDDMSPPPSSYLLSDQEPSALYDTPLGSVPLGSCLSYQLMPDAGRPKVNVVFSEEMGPPMHKTECRGFPDLPVGCGRYSSVGIDRRWLEKIAIDLDSARKLERITVLQSQSSVWLEERKLRLTSSKFGKVNARVKSVNDSFLKTIFNNKDIGHIRSVSHGNANEKPALKIYASECEKRAKHFKVFDSGLVVNPDLPHLGSTPDGKVYDPTKNSCYGLVEIKCPLTQKGLTIQQATENQDFYLHFLNGQLALKTNHKMGYYEQVQGQLALTGLPWCDFVVFLSDSREMAIIRINFNEEYWGNLLVKLNNFYIKSIPYLQKLQGD